MTIQEVIQEAVEGGWKPQDYGFTAGDTKLESFRLEGNQLYIVASRTKWDKFIGSDHKKDGEFWVHITQPLLDPSFWQALGKNLVWRDGVCRYCYLGDECEVCTCSEDVDVIEIPEWQARWHSLIDHLAEGGTIESYFKNL